MNSREDDNNSIGNRASVYANRAGIWDNIWGRARWDDNLSNGIFVCVCGRGELLFYDAV